MRLRPPNREWLLLLLSAYPGASCKIFARNYRYERPRLHFNKRDLQVNNADGFYSDVPLLPASVIKRTNQLRVPKSQRLAAEQQFLEEQQELIGEKLDAVKLARQRMERGTAVPVAFGQQAVFRQTGYTNPMVNNVQPRNVVSVQAKHDQAEERHKQDMKKMALIVERSEENGNEGDSKEDNVPRDKEVNSDVKQIGYP